MDRLPEIDMLREAQGLLNELRAEQERYLHNRDIVQDKILSIVRGVCPWKVGEEYEAVVWVEQSDKGAWERHPVRVIGVTADAWDRTNDMIHDRLEVKVHLKRFLNDAELSDVNYTARYPAPFMPENLTRPLFNDPTAYIVKEPIR